MLGLMQVRVSIGAASSGGVLRNALPAVASAMGDELAPSFSEVI